MLQRTPLDIRRVAPAVNGSPTRTKSIKGLIKNNNPLTFTARNTFPIPKYRVTGRTPIGKHLLENPPRKSIPHIGSQPSSQPGSQRQLKKSHGQGRDAKSKEAYAIEHHGVRHHLSSTVWDPAESASRFKIDSHVHTLQKPASSLQTIPGYQDRQC